MNDNSVSNITQLAQIGDNVDGYVICDILGWGGTTIVYKVTNESTNDFFAVKMLTNSALNSSEAVKRFDYEIEMLSTLRHPNIVGFHRRGVYRGLPYLLMDYVKGLNLENYLISKGQPEIKRFLSVAMQVGSAIEEIHGNGIIHRDIKLKNIMLKSVSYHAVLMDFGIAFELDRNFSITRHDYMVGTPLYMAPELFKENNASIQSDIYAYAATLYQFLTGSPPFTAASGFELYEKHANAIVRPINMSRPEAPGELETLIVEHCLAKEPKDRPGSMSEVLEELDSISTEVNRRLENKIERQAVLIADCGRDFSSTLRKLLKSEDYCLLSSDSVDEALSLFPNYEIKVMFAEQSLSRGTDLGLIERVSTIWPDTKIIVSCESSDSSNFIEAVKKGWIFKHVRKPWNEQSLKMNVFQAIEQYDLSIQNRKMRKTIDEQHVKLSHWNSQLEENVKVKTQSLTFAREELKKTLREVVRVLVELMEIHSDGLRGHGRRVAAYSKNLAEKYGLPPDEVEVVESAAMLHDLGKISLPPEILKKTPLSLSENETMSLTSHPEVAYEILKDINSFEEAAVMIKHHHENYDGRGFPDRLRGDDIPLGARIIAVADNFDRYLNPLGTFLLGTWNAMVEDLRGLSGKILDPELVDLFLNEVLPHDGDSFEEEIELPPSMLRPGMVLARDVKSRANTVFIEKGTLLDEQMIEKLSQNDRFDLFSSHLFITRTSILGMNASTDGAHTGNIVEVSENTDTAIMDPSEYIEKTVIVVEDEPGVVRALSRELRLSKYNVVGFGDVAEAWAYLKENQVCALITDYNMPGLSGERFINQVWNYRPDMPCIVITGYATRASAMKLCQSGRVVRVMTKPWDKEELLETLEDL